MAAIPTPAAPAAGGDVLAVFPEEELMNGVGLAVFDGGAHAVGGPETVAVPAVGSAERVWMPVKHAARAASVPERTAFRWAKKGVVEVRRSGKVQLVEVAALRAYAARPVNARVAAGGAVTGAGGGVAPVAAAATPVEDAARIADWDERLCALEVVFEDLFHEVEAIRKRLG
jgi:hypothetical protein